MLCCLNPECPNPENSDESTHCKECNTRLIPLLRGRYRAIKVLSNEGGFGRAYLSEDIDKLNEKCVIKQFAPKIQEPSAVKKAAKLFKQEAEQLQKLGEHQQIPALYAYFEQENYLYLVQQYIEGQNLLQELQKQGTYSESAIQEFLFDLLPVLHFIHQHGVIHRDIKPQNIIRRSSDNKFVLIDFGASKQLTATVHTRIGTAIGSHGYTPLEQMRDGQASPASDLFSLGATCFYLLTGVSPSKLWIKNGFGWVPGWRRYLGNEGGIFSKRRLKLGLVLDKLLKVDIKNRYQSADEVLRDLLRLSSPVSSTLFGVAPLQTPLSPSLVNNKPRNQFLVGGSILLLGLGVAACYYLLDRLPVIESPNREQKINVAAQSNLDLDNTLKGHSSDVNTVAFAPNGQTLATGSDDNTVKLWNLAKKQEILTLKGHKQWIWTIAFSPDGKTLASGGADKTVKLWDVATGQLIRTIQGHSGGVTSVAFSPDGRHIASGSLDKTIKIWDLLTGEETRTIKGHAKAVDCVAFSTDGTTLASGSWDNTIKLWNLYTGKEIRTLYGHSDFILSIAFSSDGMTLASGSKDKTIKLWNLLTGETILTLTGHSEKVNSVTFVMNASKTLNIPIILASGSSDSTVKLWNPATGENIRTLKNGSGYIYAIARSPDGKTIASGGSAENILKIWSLP